LVGERLSPPKEEESHRERGAEIRVAEEESCG
jgi:hypothetical protein